MLKVLRRRKALHTRTSTKQTLENNLVAYLSWTKKKKKKAVVLLRRNVILFKTDSGNPGMAGHAKGYSLVLIGFFSSKQMSSSQRPKITRQNKHL
jgi:hypothetical protein